VLAIMMGRSPVFFKNDSQIDLHIISSDGVKSDVQLLGVEYFVLNNVREGNIIDRMYQWSLQKAPSLITRRMLQALAIGSMDVLTAKFSSDVRIFHLECSYGAELFAIIHRAMLKPA